jgi:hypothetical protein
MPCSECEQLRLVQRAAHWDCEQAQRFTNEYRLSDPPIAPEVLQKSVLDRCAEDAEIELEIIRVQLAEHCCPS